MGWLSGWSKRVKITIDSGDISATLADFPILIYLSASSGIDSEDITFVFDEVGVNSKKIAVTKDDGTTECYVEIEHWDNGNNKAWLWSKIPAIASGSNTDFYLYYDNSHADNDAYVGITNSVVAENVWDVNFLMVQHMKDDPDTSHIRDSTSYDNDGTKKGANEPAVTTSGKIDDAQHFDGSDDKITISDDTELQISGNITVEAWVNGDTYTLAKFFAPVSKWNDRDGNLRCYLLGINENEPRFYISSDGTNALKATSSETFNTGTWYHFVGTFDTDILRVYLNGILRGSTDIAESSIHTNNEDVSISNDRAGGTKGQFFDGIIDEARISDIERPISWIKASYETGDDDILTYGNEEEASGVPAWLTMTTNWTCK